MGQREERWVQMIGSIIQAVMQHFKDTGKVIDENSEKTLRSSGKAPEFEKEEVKEVESKEPKEEVTETQEVEEVKEEPTEEQEDKDEDKDNTNLGNTVLSDEDLKDILTKKESTEEESSSGPSGMQIFSLVNGIRKKLASVGQSLQGKDTGDSGDREIIKSAYDIYQSRPNKEKKIEQVAKQTSTVPSDECLKQFFYEDDDNTFHDTDLLEAYKRLNSVEFTYNDEAVKLDPTQDTETVHNGLLAQDIKAQPELESAVVEDPNTGYYMVDIREMTMNNAAAISDIVKKLETIENALKSNGLGG